MGFIANQNEAYSGGIKPAGDYECIITAIEEHITKNGAKGLDITMVVRNDVAGQRFGGGCIFYTIWRKKEPNENDMQVEGYNFAQLMAIGKAARLTDGKAYESLKDYCADLLNKCVRVTLKHEEYNGKPQERVSYVNPTLHPECRHVFKSSAPQPQPSVQAAQTAVMAAESAAFDDGVPF